MDSQFSDIRKEYKKGKLTRNTISENPFEQFARWLNDALHSFGISWKDKYISKEKQRNALLKNRTLTSPPDPTKAGSAQEYPPKVTSSAAGWK